MSYILLICFLILTSCAIITTVCAVKDSDLFNKNILEDIDSEYDKFITVNDIHRQLVYVNMYTIIEIYFEKENNNIVISTDKDIYIEHYSCEEDADDRLIELLNTLRLFY